MSNAPLHFLADVNISPITVSELQDQNWNATRVTNNLPPDATDKEILSHARKMGQVIVTQDLDFSTLLALGAHPQPSLITLRLPDSSPRAVSRRLLTVLPHVTDDLQSGAAVTITDEDLRVRSLPIS